MFHIVHFKRIALASILLVSSSVSGALSSPPSSHHHHTSDKPVVPEAFSSFANHAHKEPAQQEKALQRSEDAEPSPILWAVVENSSPKCVVMSKEDRLHIEKLTQKPLSEQDLCVAHQSTKTDEEIFLSLAYAPVIERIVEKYKTSPAATTAIVRASHLEAKKHNLDPLLVLSVIATESSFNPKARNPSGALGLMQAIPKWHGDKISSLGISSSQLLNIRENVALGTLILKDYLNLSRGNTQNALQRYNGSSKDRSYKYSNKVLRHYRYLSDTQVKSLPN